MDVAFVGAGGAWAPVLLDIFPLPIFPEGGLGRSIVTTVFIGLVIMVFFNETYGWVMSGMVVPGYLAPILLINPWSGTVIIVEALLAHGLVRLTSAVPARIGLWNDFFGRDRFFAYLLYGVLVRAVGEGFLFHRVGAFLNEALGLQIDYRNNFYSVGLIVVPLLANMFFKPGVKRGLIPVSLSIGITYAIVRFLLIPYTNFSISSFEIAYGYYATSFLGNAKAYIILLTTAFLASRANLRYGWDYSGILIPSLLALAWFRPLKVVTSVLEAILVLQLAKVVAGSRLLSAITIEGGRKLLLCFTVGFALKIFSDVVVGHYFPGIEATELYGFGYLLPSLIANKMWQRGSIPFVLRPILQTSLVGMLAGSGLAGLLLFLLPPGTAPGAAPVLGAPGGPVVASVEGELYGTLVADKARLVRRQDRKGVDRIVARELERFREGLRLVLAAAEAPPGSDEARERLDIAARVLDPIDYQVVRLEDPYRGVRYVVRERADLPGLVHGWGIYVVNARPSADLVIEVPRPLAEWKAIEAGAALFERFQARALFVAGGHFQASRDGSADVLTAPATPFQAAHLLLRKSHVLAVRGEVDRSSLAPGTQVASSPGVPVRLYLEGELPEPVKLAELAAIGGGPPELVLPGRGRLDEGRNMQRETAVRTFSTLFVSPDAARRLISQHYAGSAREREADVIRMEGYLLNWLAEERDAVAGSGSERYVPPGLGDLIFMDEEVLTPIVELEAAGGAGRRVAGSEAESDILRQVARAADALGYQVILYTQVQTGERYLVLREDAERRRHRGLFIFKLDAAEPYAIEVPHPITDLYTFEASARLFEYLRARALIVAGASRYANADGRADVLDPRNIRTFFQLAHQVLARESRGTLLAVETKGFASQAADAGIDVVLSLGHEVKRRVDIPAPVLALERELRFLGADVAYFDGSLRTLRFQGAQSAQLNYSEVHYPGTFVFCWLSSEFREAFRNRLVSPAQRVPFAELGIADERGSLLSLVRSFVDRRRRREAAPGATPPPEGAAVDAAVARAVTALRRYGATLNVLHLVQANEAASAAGARILHFLDVGTNRTYLLLLGPEGAEVVVFLADLHPGAPDEVRLYRGTPTLHADLESAVRRSFDALFILEGEGPR